MRTAKIETAISPASKATNVAAIPPTSALFRHGEAWAVYTIDRGRARRTIIGVGHRTGQMAEVVSGLAPGTRVILHPGDTLVDGARVRERSTT